MVFVDVEIDLGKSLEENASAYFEKSKLAKKKLLGLRKAMLQMEKKVGQVGKSQEQQKLERKRKRQWFESFNWFRSSQGFLVIGGRDARSNETVVKKHLDKDDIFMHADIQGGSVCVIKAEGKQVPEETLEETAQFAAAKSKAWQQELASVDVYAVSKEQVSKTAPSGEALSTGSFMINGKRQWFRKTPLRFAVGLVMENKALLAMGGPPRAVKKNSISSFGISFGREKRSDVAKRLLALFSPKNPEKEVSLDDLVNVLPGEKLSIREQF